MTPRSVMLPRLPRLALFAHSQLARSLHSWPTSARPSPYEIFGMTPSSFDKAKLKPIYIEMAKVYHPDRNGSPQRFKQLTEAYNILCNDQKRRMIDTPFSPNYTPRARPFRDPYDADLDMKAGEERFRASLQENRHFILKVVVSIAVLVAIMELTALFKATDNRVARLEDLSQRAAMANHLASSNYHKGSTAQERVDRFLAQREFTLQNSNSFRYNDISARD